MSLYPSFRPLFFDHRPSLPARSAHVPSLSCSGPCPLSTPPARSDTCRRPARAREQRYPGFATRARVPLQKCGSSERSDLYYQKFSGVQLPPPRDGRKTRDFWVCYGITIIYIYIRWVLARRNIYIWVLARRYIARITMGPGSP